MNLFNKRPLLLSLFIFAVCYVFSTCFTTFIKIIALSICSLQLLIFITLTVVYAIRKNSSVKVLATLTLCIFFATIALASSYFFFDNKLKDIERLGTEEDVVAQIEECTYSASYITVYTAKIKEINGNRTNFKASISSEQAVHFENGQTIVADMSFSPFSVTLSGYDERKSNISSGILTSATFEEATLLNSSFSISIFKLRDAIRNKIDAKYVSAAPLIKALLIGDTEDVDAMTKSNFSRLGISHILSISGVHFTVLLGMVAILLSALGLNKRLVYVLLIPFAVLYMGLSGFSFSVCRAGLMAILSYFGFLLGRQRDSYTALFISLAIILTVTPYSVLSVSLWLSFTATFAILALIDLCYSWLSQAKISLIAKLLRYVVFSFLITVSVTFATLPIIAIYFGYVSLISPLANLLIVPLFELFLYVVPFSVIFADFKVIVIITEYFEAFLMKIVERIASIDNLLIAVNQNFVLIISCIGILTTLILLALPLKRKFIIALPALICSISIAVGLFLFYEDRYDETFVSYFNAGISDQIVITDTNQTMCIDISNGSSDSMYYTQAVVKDHYSTKISAYVFTHYRSNHISSLKKLAQRTKIEKVYLPIATEGSSEKYMNSVAFAAEEMGIEVIYYDYGSTLKFCECKVTVFEPQFLKRTSHEVISFFVSTYKDDLLYLGSAYAETKFDYSAYICDAEYLILGQHYPKIKQNFTIDSDAELVFGSEEVFALSNAPARAYILNNGEEYNFMLK